MAGMTSSPSPSRVSPGVPAGGQFAAQDQAELVARLLAEATPGGYDAVYSYGPEVQERAVAKVARCRTELDEATAAEAPFHDEFTRRGT